MSSDAPAPSDKLTDGLYGALRSLAVRALSSSARLDPTELVHQAWVRLARVDDYKSLPRSEFLALCATVMRRIAIDEARRRQLAPHDPNRITLSGVAGDAETPEIDLLALDEALTDLRKEDERWARIVELRFFGGLSGDEIASMMGLSRRTVTREWTLARAWLKRRME